ncbi:MAG: queuosine precursor transporter [Deltaproteobacteria bacterium]|nr:queuosine precursor transporter [Deltaproteobacteria bacterium]
MPPQPPQSTSDDPEILEATGSLPAPNPDVPGFLTADQKLYWVLGAVFVSSLLVGDMIGGKFFSIAGTRLSVGIIPFPVTYVLTDVINEFYGRRGARFITFVAAAMAVYAYLILQIAIALPVADGSPIPQEAFQTVFGFGLRLFAASILAFLISQLVDIAAFGMFKRLTRSRHIWLRATGSTAISQLVDTFVINFVLLTGTMTTLEIWRIVLDSYLYKLIAAVVLTPVIYALHGLVIHVFRIHPEGTVRRGEGI